MEEKNIKNFPQNLTESSNDEKSKIERETRTRNQITDPLKQVVVYKRLAKMPMRFLTKRRQLRNEQNQKVTMNYNDETAGILAASYSSSSCFGSLNYENKPDNFGEYTQKLEQALKTLSNFTLEDCETETALSVLRFLENIINQPKEWISGAKLKLSEMKFPETAMILMRNYKEKGYLVRRIVFVHSILLYNTLGNITDHEFDKEGLIRKQSADVGFIEFACDVLNFSSYRESLKKVYVIQTPEEVTMSDDFDNFQKILYICDSALTILYNMANLPELKVVFRDCNAVNVIVEYTKLSSESIKIDFLETEENQEIVSSLKELQEIISAVRITSSLLLTLIINEDEDNIVAMNNAEIFRLLSVMIQKYDQFDKRFYGFSFIELVDGLSRIMVRGRTFKLIDEDLVPVFLKSLRNVNQDHALLECVSNAILNLSFDEKVQRILERDSAVEIITSARDNCPSQLVQKNCEAILWTINRNTARRIVEDVEQPSSQSHIMISYNRSVMAMCLKIRDRLKALHYNVWLDVDNINGGVLESMAGAIEKSFVVLICMNEQYKQSHYCRLEAEYATELRKPCIPCLMQPRFCPYGWLGIIKGAKFHVDFALLPFEEAFSVLIREIETIRFKKSPEAMSKSETVADNSTVDSAVKCENIQPHGAVSSITTTTKPLKRTNPISHWKSDSVNRWLESIGLSRFEIIFPKLTGPLLWQLYQMKLSAPDAFYKLIDKQLERFNMSNVTEILLFDYELERLFDVSEYEEF